MAKIYKNLNNQPVTRTLLNADYEQTHVQMLSITLKRIEERKNAVDGNVDEYVGNTQDELWIVEHNDVYTLGQAGKPEHILQRGETPIIQTDRGGQVTWHGKGQLVMYWLFDINRLGWSVRDLVSHAEQSIEDVLNEALSTNTATSDLYARARQDAPGVYIYRRANISSQRANTSDHDRADANMNDANHPLNEDALLGKIASLGFKIKHGLSYHGVAINLNCDLSAFDAINPCGYKDMQMLRLADFVDLAGSDAFGVEGLVIDPLDSEALNFKKLNTETLSHDTHKHTDTRTDKSDNNIATLEFTQRLVNNIKARHAGNLPLRDS